jgi:sulfatase maturation enzyme AslB (radical SAM superfamily)
MTMTTLESIGFYTLSDARVKQASVRSPLWRGELVLSARCNFKCPYCRHVERKSEELRVGGSIPSQATI